MRTLLVLCITMTLFNVKGQFDLKTVFPVNIENCNRDTIVFETGYYSVYYNNGLDSNNDTAFVQYGVDFFRYDGRLESSSRGRSSYYYTVHYREDGSVKDVVYGFDDLFGTAISYFPDGSVESVSDLSNGNWNGWTIYYDDDGNETHREFYIEGMLRE